VLVLVISKEDFMKKTVRTATYMAAIILVATSAYAMFPAENSKIQDFTEYFQDDSSYKLTFAIDEYESQKQN
jgi:hypothetical protein